MERLVGQEAAWKIVKTTRHTPRHSSEQRMASLLYNITTRWRHTKTVEYRSKFGRSNFVSLPTEIYEEKWKNCERLRKWTPRKKDSDNHCHTSHKSQMCRYLPMLLLIPVSLSIRMNINCIKNTYILQLKYTTYVYILYTSANIYECIWSNNTG